jgi:hypothetical protein
MSKLDDKHVVTGNAVVIWDGITRPETKDGNVIHSLKVALAPGSPEIDELKALVQSTLAADPKFKGALPPGGQLPFIVAGTDKPSPDPQVSGYTMINAKTRVGAPTVHELGGRVMNPMEYGAMLYPGAVVQIIVHAFAYDTAGNTGVAFGIDGIMIVDATVPKLAIASGVDTVAAFGGAPVAAAVSAPPVPQAAPAPPAPDFLNPPTGVAAVPVMTPKANDMPYQQWVDQGWTDEQLIAQGYMTV